MLWTTARATTCTHYCGHLSPVGRPWCRPASLLLRPALPASTVLSPGWSACLSLHHTASPHTQPPWHHPNPNPQALAAKLCELYEQWWLLVVQLEHQMHLGRLNLAALIYFCQAPGASLELLASIAVRTKEGGRDASHTDRLVQHVLVLNRQDFAVLI